MADSSSEDECNPKVEDMIRMHRVRLRCLEHFYQKPKLRRYKYYGAGFVLTSSELSDANASSSMAQMPSPPKVGRGGSSASRRGSDVNPKPSPRRPKKKKQPVVAAPTTVTTALPEVFPSPNISDTVQSAAATPVTGNAPDIPVVVVEKPPEPSSLLDDVPTTTILPPSGLLSIGGI